MTETWCVGRGLWNTYTEDRDLYDELLHIGGAIWNGTYSCDSREIAWQIRYPVSLRPSVLRQIRSLKR